MQKLVLYLCSVPFIFHSHHLFSIVPQFALTIYHYFPISTLCPQSSYTINTEIQCVITIKFIFHKLALHLCNTSLIFHSHHLFSTIPYLALTIYLSLPLSLHCVCIQTTLLQYRNNISF
jgi:hypothetical protein